MTEVAGAAAAAEILADVRPASPVETAEAHRDCANCGAHLQGQYCHACGQRAHLHTKLRHLFHELVEGITHLDGRLWRTLPLLAFKPGTLSRRWRDGKRAAYTSPLHVFLFAIFLLFILPNFTGRHLISLPTADETGAMEADIRAARAAQSPPPAAKGGTLGVHLDGVPSSKAWEKQLEGRWLKVKKNPEFYSYKVESLAYKLSFVIVPISMAILWVLLLFKRGYTLYDHGVVSLYGVGFFVLLLAFATTLPSSLAAHAVRATMVIAPLHAIVHLHGAYRLSWFGAVVRGLLLGLFSAVGFGFFLTGVLLLGAFL